MTDAGVAGAEKGAGEETGKTGAKSGGRRRRGAATKGGKAKAKAPTRKTSTKTKSEAPARPEAPSLPETTAKRASLDEVLGQVARLMAASPKHKHLFLADLEWLVMPPMALGQARLLRDEQGRPFAFACWARVSEEVEQRLQAGNPRLKPEDWRSGDRPWLIDLVAPEQAVPTVLATLQKEVFKGEKVRTLFPIPGGQKQEVGDSLGSRGNREGRR